MDIPFEQAVSLFASNYRKQQIKNSFGPSRTDEEPASWITLSNGEHVPLDASGNAIGGAGGWAKGKNFSKATSEKKESQRSSDGESKKRAENMNKKLDKAMESEDDDTRYYAIRDVLKNADVGSSFKVGNIDITKVKDSEDENEPIFASKYSDHAIMTIKDAMRASWWEMEDGKKPEFYDREAAKQRVQAKITRMRDNGEVDGTDEMKHLEKGCITASSEDFGKPGKYVMYRTGAIGSSGMIFFAPTKSGADTYASLHDEKTGQYTAEIRNPLVVKGETDVELIQKAWKALHPGETPVKSGGNLTAAKWKQLDKQNASALSGSGYDAIFYMLGDKPHEIQIPAKQAKRLSKLATYTTTKWSRLGHSLESALYSGEFDKDPQDFKRLDGNFDSADEEHDVTDFYYFMKEWEQEDHEDDTANEHRSDSAYDEWLEENMDKFSDDKEEIDFANTKDEHGNIIRNAKDVSEVERAWDEFNRSRSDGGPGSGNFGHEGRPGEVGGSGPAEYAGLSEEGRDIIKEHIRNPYHFGSSDEQKSANRQKLIRALSDIGVKVDYDKEEDTYSMISTNMSYEENRAIGAALNQGRFYRTVDREEYCRKCKEDGKVPRLHETPDTFPDGWLISKSGKTMTDGTPVYKALSKEGVLSDKELVDFSGLDREVSPEGAEKARKATAEAIDKMSNAERNALHNYTKQWSGENYQAVNGYLVTGEGDERAKKAAENVTSALDHPIGVDCITMRGDNGVYGTGKDEAITKLVNKVAKGDFSAAKKLQDMLTGKTITNKAAMSTSPNDTTSGYGQRPVQYVFKTPKDAKAVDISQLSSFGGGRSEVEKKLAATGLFGAVEHESEVLFKPGTRYKIDEVKFSAEFDRKGKRTGQVFIIATILTGNEDSRNDGGPGSGNHGHKGVPGQIGGSAPGNGSREVREGKDLSKTITGVVPISYVLKKQGYDGLPKVVGQKEFDKAVKESKFIAQRSYTASSKEVLDAYRNQLWNGDFYAECSVGGAQYGQGMYCASDYDGNLTDGIREEMDHYNRLGDKRYGREMSDEERCEKSIEYLKKWKEVEFTDDLEEYVRAQFSGDLARYSEAEKKVTPKQKAFANVAEEEIGMYEDAPEYIETLTLDPSAKVISYDDIRSIQYGNGTDACRKYERDFVDPFIQEAIEKHGLSEEEITFIKDRLRVLTDDEEESLKPEAVKWYTSLEQSERDKVGKKLINIVVPIRETLYAQERINRQLDTGAFAALLGYDAIKADAHGKSGSYTVILNRTKTIFLDDSIHEDAKDDHSITFQFGDDGVLYAIKDRKVIGWVRALEASNRGGNEDSRTDDKEPKDWITINGTHVPIDESGEITGKVAEKIKGTSTNKSEPKDNLLKDLHPDVEYPERVEYWKEQIKKGNHRPVLVDKKDPTRVIDGNHTLAAYQELGMEPEVYAMDRIEFLNGAGEADDTVEYIRNAIKEGKAEKIGGGKPTTGQKTVGDKMKPANTDYEYDDGDDQDTWTNKNVKKLMPIYKKGGSDAIDSEFRKFKMDRTTKDIHEIGKDEADAVVYDNVRQSLYDGWFRNADSSYKPALVDRMLSSPEMRNAGLSLAYENYRQNTEEPLSFEEFLTTPIKMYRGGHGQKHTKDDIFSAYTFDRKMAEQFAGKGGAVTEAEIRPIDTYGSMRAVGEAEIWVPSEIAPNGNKDSREDGRSKPFGFRQLKSMLENISSRLKKPLAFRSRSAIVKSKNTNFDGGPRQRELRT